MTLPPQADAVGAHTPGPVTIRQRANNAGDPNGRFVILGAEHSLREEFFICEMPFAAVRSGDAAECKANSLLIAEAFDVATETGLTPRQLAERHADLTKQRDELVAALRLHKAWADSEEAGPDYGGQTRDTHPDGERIWKAWWNNQLDLCERATAATDEALARVEGGCSHG